MGRICGEEPPSKHSLATLAGIQRRAIRLIGDPALTNALDSLAHCSTVFALCFFKRFIYRYGVCSDDIQSIIPSKASFARNTRFSMIQHHYAIKLETNRTNAFANSIPMTSRDWNLLPPSVFLIHITFSLSRHVSTPVLSTPTPPPLQSLLLFTIQWSTADYRD